MTKALFVCYDKCSTCKKAEKWLQDNNIEFDKRAIKTENPTYEELKEWYVISGLPIKRFFNTSGMLYREMKLKDKVATESDDVLLKILATDGMLVKRPLLITSDTVLVGFKEKDYEELI